MLLRLKPTKRTLGMLGGGLVALILLIGSVFYFQNEALAQRSTTLDAKQKELNEGQKIARRREAAHEELEKDKAQLAFLENSVSDAAYVPTLLKQVEELAKSTNNRVVAVRPQVVTEAPTKLQQRRDPNAGDKPKDAPAEDKEKKETKKPDPYTKLNITLSVVGSFKSTEQFIERLTRFPKIMAVEELSLRPHPSTKDDRSALLDVELKLTAFVMKDAAPPVQPANTAVTANAAVKGVNP